MLKGFSVIFLKKAIYWGLVLTIAITPLLIATVLINHYFDSGIGDFSPGGLGDITSFWSDEMFYWHETATFSRYGFDGGYYTIDELVAKADFLHFEAHGPAFPVLYSLLAIPLGWDKNTGVILNFAILTFSILLFIIRLRPNSTQFFLLFGVILTFWPMHLFTVSNMQENLHQGIAILLASIALTKSRDGHFWRNGCAGALIGIFVLALLRFTWVFVLLPFCLLGKRDISTRNIIKAVVFSIFFITITYIITTYIGGSYPHSFLYELGTIAEISSWDALLFFLDHLKWNILRFLNPVGSELPVTVQRYAYLFLILFSLSKIVKLYRTKTADRIQNESILSTHWFFQFLCLSSFLLVVALFYEFAYFRDFRVLSAPFLMSLLVLIGKKSYKPVILCMLFMAFAFPDFNSTYKHLHASHFEDKEEVYNRFHSKVSSHLNYIENADPWCNTILVDIISYPLIREIPPGIGVSATLDMTKMNFPLNSRYILVPPNLTKIMSRKIYAKVISVSEFGTLLLNLNSKCRARSPMNP